MHLFTFVLTLLWAWTAHAQSVTPEGCLRLLGSVACPGFQYAYLSPSNLSNAFPFFAGVTDVKSFDAGALNYFSDPYQFKTTKFINQLGCSNASSATIRYQRTVLCSMWVNEKWSTQCMAYYNGSAAATSQKMVCQETCLDWSASETALVNSSTYCPGDDLTNGNRTYQLNKDFVDCTNWTTLATNDTEMCVMGSENEGNCGYGTSTTELCTFCKSDKPDACCYAGSTDISVCGYALPPQASTTSGSPSQTSSGGPASTSGSLQNGNSGSSSSRLSGGKIAGIVVGSVIGGLLLLALLAFLLLGCIRRRRSKRQSGVSFGNPNPAPGMFGFLKSPNSNTQPPHNSSEKGLLGTTPGAAASSPTMGGDTLYAQSGHGKSSENGAMMLTPASTAAAAFAGLPGDRSSGVVLPRVKDENQGGNVFIETGSEVTVLWPYQASLPDELDLRPGMKLRVLRLYDDAWGTAQVIVGGSEGSVVGKQGAFPIVCVSEGSSLGSSQASSGSH